jgi:hypothetical protein
MALKLPFHGPDLSYKNWYVEILEGAMSMELRVKRPCHDLELLAGFEEDPTVYFFMAHRRADGWWDLRDHTDKLLTAAVERVALMDLVQNYEYRLDDL